MIAYLVRGNVVLAGRKNQKSTSIADHLPTIHDVDMDEQHEAMELTEPYSRSNGPSPTLNEVGPMLLRNKSLIVFLDFFLGQCFTFFKNKKKDQ